MRLIYFMDVGAGGMGGTLYDATDHVDVVLLTTVRMLSFVVCLLLVLIVFSLVLVVDVRLISGLVVLAGVGVVWRLFGSSSFGLPDVFLAALPVEFEVRKELGVQVALVPEWATRTVPPLTP